jgi:hypothetical protein
MPTAALHRLVYVSRCRAQGAVFESLTEEIVAVSARNNAGAGLTGLLVAADGWFLQTLEGPRREVSTTFARIAADTRHFDFEIISAGPVDGRLFGRWSMTARTLTPAAAPVLEMLGARNGLNPHELDNAGALRLMLTVANVSDGLLERPRLRA